MRTPIKVFILAGQSNMVGSDAHSNKIDSYPAYKGADAPQPDVRFTSLPDLPKAGFQGWSQLTPSDAFGPEITFARAVTKALKQPIAIIKSAIGGTTAAYDWNPDAPERGQKLTPRTLELIRGALKNLTEQGIPYTIEGVLWHQGENDMLDRSINGSYAANLTRIIKQFRTDLGLPNLKWYMGEVSTKGIWGMDNRANLAILRKQQQQVLDADKLITFVPTSHLAFDVMGSGQPHYHFGTQGQLQMGDAFADAYLAAIGKKSRTKSMRFRHTLPVGSSIHLVVIAGQRNSEGEDAFVQDLNASPKLATLAAPQQNILYRYSLGAGAEISNDWEPLRVVSKLGNFGPELSLGATLRAQLPATDGLAIIKFTHSGAQLPDWSPAGSAESQRNLYKPLRDFIVAAIKDLEKRGYVVNVNALFWHAGENDTYYTPYLRGYGAKLQAIFSGLRKDINQPSLRCFVSEQHPKSPWANVAAMNAELKQMVVSDRERLSVIVPTHTLPHGKTHFGSTGTIALGNAYDAAQKDQ